MTLEDQTTIALAKYNSKYVNETYLEMRESFGRDHDALRANLAIDAALWICGHPSYTINKLMNLFALISGRQDQIMKVYRFLGLFIDEPLEEKL
jgi:hypothetical protein